jgi:hypothetical protein
MPSGPPVVKPMHGAHNPARGSLRCVLRLIWAPIVLLACASCAEAPAADPLSIRVSWGLTGTSALPPNVTEIEIVTCVGPGQSASECTNVTCSIGALTLMRPDGGPMEVPQCRPREGTEMFGSEPVLVRSALATGTPIRFELRGRAGGAVLYRGQAGPFVLGEGDRRFVELRMYPTDASIQIGAAPVQRFLHTATRLPDGRVLIAGGFDTAERMDTCPSELFLAADSRCFELTATASALAFEVSSGRVEEIRDSMIEARAGHTATALPDGRVLIAGGAPRAILAMEPQGGVGAPGGHAIRFFPQNEDGTEGAHASFELFDAYLDSASDPERDGDLGAGRFLGTFAQTSSPGPLNRPRFLHAAAQIPDSPSRVVLVGGTGSRESEQSWEVFDNEKPGGFGVHRGGGNQLRTARPMPSAIGIGARVWIFGGGLAHDNSELGELWESTADPNGALVDLSTTAFPREAAKSTEQYPQYSLTRPAIGTVADGSRALAIGWYGPQCDRGSSTPRFATIGVSTEYCDAPAGGSDVRSFTVADSTGITQPTPVRPHAFAEAAVLTCFKPENPLRWLAIPGGISSTRWLGQLGVDIFDGTVNGAGAAQTLPGDLSITTTRAFHTATGLPGLGLVVLGGIDFSDDFTQLFFVDTPEVIFVSAPAPTDC